MHKSILYQYLILKYQPHAKKISTYVIIIKIYNYYTLPLYYSLKWKIFDLVFLKFNVNALKVYLILIILTRYMNIKQILI